MVDGADELSAESEVPIVVGFDVEPDGLDIPRRERRAWTGFERTLEVIDQLRPRLEDALRAPVAFSWHLRMDPQIEEVYGSASWVADAYGVQLDKLRAAGDELGLHPHALRWDDRRNGWLAAIDDEPWVQECVRVSFDAYRAAFGQPCRSHRYGDSYMGTEIVAIIRELGATSDLTVEPGRPAHDMSSTERPLSAQFGVPRTPYQPDPADYTLALPRPQPGGLWVLPLASVNPDPALPAWRRLARRARHRGMPMHRPALLWAPWPTTLLWDLARADVDRGLLSVLPFMVRADTLLNPEWAASFKGHLMALAKHPLAARARLRTPSAVVTQLDAQPN